jgi:hypothetical protein
VTHWELRNAVERAHWDAWAEAVQTARHPALAKVTGCERDGNLASLTLLDPESEDIGTWAARTGATVPQRLAVLRTAAAALDALYAGATTDVGIPHGGIATSSIRVDREGMTRVVGFSPWERHDAEDARFAAPELDQGMLATRSGDVYAFARVVAEVLGGPTVAAAAEPGDVARVLRANPDTRRRARLIRAIHSALASPAEARAQPLTDWLAAAVEGTAVTEIGSRTVLPADDRGVPAPSRRHPMRSVAWLCVAVALVLGGWWLRPSGEHPDAPDPAGHEPLFTMKAVSAQPCGETVAGLGEPDGLHRPMDISDLDGLPNDLAVGRLQRGRVLISMQARDDEQSITIDKVEAERVQVTSSPAWAAYSSSACIKQGASDRSYVANLDTQAPLTLADPGDPNLFSPDPSAGFALHAAPIEIAIDAVACDQSYEWRPRVYYTRGTTSGTWSPRSSFFLYGTASGASRYEVTGSGAPPQVVDDTPVDPACGGSRG